MTRSRASAKAAGSKFERLIADWLRFRLGVDHIDRRVKTGANDKGDIGGVKTIRGGRVVLELKDYAGQVMVKPWLREAAVEALNDGAVVGAVVFKVRGEGDPAKQAVLMTTETFARLIEGGPDLEPVVVADPMTEVTAA